MTEKIINGTRFRFEKDKVYNKVYNGLEYCIDYMYKEKNDGSILIETPRNEETIKAKFEAGWKRLSSNQEGYNVAIIEYRGKTIVYNSSSDFTLPVPNSVNDFIRIYLIKNFKSITVEGSCYYDGQDPVITWATIEK